MTNGQLEKLVSVQAVRIGTAHHSTVKKLLSFWHVLKRVPRSLCNPTSKAQN